MSTINREMIGPRPIPEAKGIHDVHRRMRIRTLYEAMGQVPKDGCHAIGSAAVAPYGLLPEDIPDTMDPLMTYHHDCERRWWVLDEGVLKPGDYIALEVEIDCLVALSNCRYYRGTPIRIEVLEMGESSASART